MPSERDGTPERGDALISFGGVLTTATVYDPAIFSAGHLPYEQADGVYVRRCSCRALAVHNFGCGIPLGTSHAAFVDGVIAEGKAEVNDADSPMRVDYDV